MAKRRLVIVGNGMATCRLLDELVARGATARYEITVFGEEPSATYNRILLSRVLAGEAPDDIVTKDAAWFADHGIRLVTGLAVRRLDTARKLVETEDGAAHRYDTVVLATGSQPLVPAIDGATVEGGALRRGGVAFVVSLSPEIRPDTLFAPFHWGGRQAANVLTVPALDPVSRMPEFKVCAVRARPLPAEAAA